MFRARIKVLLGSVALLVAATVAGGSAAAYAAPPEPGPGTYYEMHLSSTCATVQPGSVTTTVITFEADRRLRHARVDLSVSGLPDGVTASFAPQRPRVGGSSTLTLTTAPASAPAAATITVSAMVEIYPSDPIGTSTTFQLTLTGR